MDDKVLFLYAQGMTTREIVTTFKEMYSAENAKIATAEELLASMQEAGIDRSIVCGFGWTRMRALDELWYLPGCGQSNPVASLGSETEVSVFAGVAEKVDQQ